MRRVWHRAAGQRYRKAGAAKRACRHHGDGAALELDDAARDGEAKPCSAWAAGPEGLEEVGQVGGCDTRAGVVDVKRNGARVEFCGHLDGSRTAVWEGVEEADGVLEQVEEDLLQTVGRARHAGVGRDGGGDACLVAGRLGFEEQEQASEERGEVYRVVIDAGLSREAEVVFGECVEAGDVGLDAAECEAGILAGAGEAIGEHLGVEAHAGEGVSDLVGNAACELACGGEPFCAEAGIVLAL